MNHEATCPSSWQKTLSGIKTVMRFEGKNYITSRAFKIATLVTLLLIAFSTFSPLLMDGLHRLNPANKTTKLIYIQDPKGFIKDFSFLEKALPDLEVRGLNAENYYSTIEEVPEVIRREDLEKELEGGLKKEPKEDTPLSSKEKLTTKSEKEQNLAKQKNQGDPPQKVLTAEATDKLGPHDTFDYLVLSEADPDIQGIFVIQDIDQYAWYTLYLDQQNTLANSLRALISKEITKEFLEKKGLKADEIAQVTEPASLKLVELTNKRGIPNLASTFPYAVSMILILYIFILTYGQRTATIVAAEKSNRAMEILITSTSPAALIHGKVLGLAIVGILQLIFFGWAYYFFTTLAKIITIKLDYPPVATLFSLSTLQPRNLLMSLIIFLIAYLTYAYLYASLGSFVNRTEELSQLTTPISSLILGIFMLALLATNTPGALWVRILSYVPLFGILVFYARFSLQSLALWQILVPLLLHSISIYFVANFAIHLYHYGVLQYGKTPRWKELFSLMVRKAE